MRVVPAAALALAILVPIRAVAAEPAYSAGYRQCMSRAGGVTASMVACITAEYRRFDARLNAAYRIALRQRPERRDALVRAERAWLTYRTANCDYYLDPDGGTLARDRFQLERALRGHAQHAAVGGDARGGAG